MRLLGGIAIAATAMAGPAAAEGSLAVGAGGVDCGIYLDFHDKPGPVRDEVVTMMRSWIQGYVSGLNAMRQATGSDVVLLEASVEATDALHAAVVRLCRAEPNRPVLYALDEHVAVETGLYD